MSTLLQRTAAAPISWGVCEMPGWGKQLPADRVLSEMAQLGFPATELGSVGYLPTEPETLAEALAMHGLSLTAGFNALPLADPANAAAAVEQARRSADLLAGAGAHTFITCAVSDPADWQRVELSGAQWDHLTRMLDEVNEICDGYGLTQAFHPHVGSLVETAAEIERVLATSSVGWVLDTGHLAIGGFDPVQFAREHHERVRIAHLKDVSGDMAAQLRAGRHTLMEAVQHGLFVPLGTGDADIAEVVTTLEAAAYQGWYVIEQDAAITGEFPPPGEGPFRDVASSVAFLRTLGERLEAS